jgi:hypothetical protein
MVGLGYHAAPLTVQVYKRGKAACGTDLYKPLAVAFAAELRKHLLQVGKVRAETGIKLLGANATCEREGSIGSIAEDGDLSSLDAGAGREQRDGRARRGFILALLQDGRDLTPIYDYVTIACSKKDFDCARKLALAQVFDERVQEKVTRRQVLVY